MTFLAWVAVAAAKKWAEATDDQTSWPVLERCEAELWDLTHPPRRPSTETLWVRRSEGCYCGDPCKGHPPAPPRRDAK